MKRLISIMIVIKCLSFMKTKRVKIPIYILKEVVFIRRVLNTFKDLFINFTKPSK